MQPFLGFFDTYGGNDGDIGVGEVRIGVLCDYLELLREFTKFRAVAVFEAGEVVVDFVNLALIFRQLALGNVENGDIYV